jgi:hypothetical protein
LLGLLVLPKLQETAAKFGIKTRLSFIGSDLQYIAKYKEGEISGSILDALSKKEDANISDRYNVSKLLLLYSVREFAARSPLGPDHKHNVIINYTTPGACDTDIFRDDMSWLGAVFHSIMIKLIARTTEQGSRTLVYAAKPDIEEDTHGAFLMDCKVAPNGANVDSPKGQKNQERWIEELLPKLESISPGVTKVLAY